MSNEYLDPTSIKTREQFEQVLVKHGIDINDFNTHGSKNSEDLYHEFISAECRIGLQPLRREVQVVQLMITHTDRVLVEVEQELTSGICRKRQLLPSEKCQKNEDLVAAANRLVAEEFAHHITVGAMTSPLWTRRVEAASPSYFQMQTLYVIHVFKVEGKQVPDNDFWTVEQQGSDQGIKHRWQWQPLSWWLARDAVWQASLLARQIQQEMVDDHVMNKKDKSPVTVADFAVQALVSYELSRVLPHIPLVAEEDAHALRDGKYEHLQQQVIQYVQQCLPELSGEQILDAIDRGNYPGGSGTFWVLDPIDGTKGFLRKDQYAVCLGLIHKGDVVTSALGCPHLSYGDSQKRGLVMSAINGAGVWQQSLYSGDLEAVSMPKTAYAKDACFVESVERGHSNHELQATIAKNLGVIKESVRIDSQCKFVVLARGDADIYLRFTATPGYDNKLWDIAPGSLLVKEAGGKVADEFGKPLCFTNGRTLGVSNLFACHKDLFDDIVEVIKGDHGTR